MYKKEREETRCRIMLEVISRRPKSWVMNKRNIQKIEELYYKICTKECDGGVD